MTVVAPTRAVVAADVMQSPIVSVPPTATVAAAWSVMMRTGLRHLVIAVGDHCLGVVDDRMVFAEWPMGPLALRRRFVRDIARSRPTCVSPNTELRSVARVMVGESIDVVPVVSDAGRLVGIVTGSDIARAVAAGGVLLADDF